ncbi:MAG TPA: diacylglycerol kinase family protein [Ohtaekwangia sp.]
MLRIAVILNGISLEKKHFLRHVFPAISEHARVEVFETRSKNDAVKLASKAVDKRFDVILAAGGDGTVHQVVNGMLQERETHTNLPVFAVFPVGTGNDFARSFHIVSHADQLIFLLRNFNPRTIDVGEVDFTTDSGRGKSYFINVADIGMGPEVVSKLNNSGRPLGSAAAYYMAILATFATYKTKDITATTPDWIWKGKIRSLAIANGKFYGHGLCIAPDAKPDDQIFDAFICGDISVLDFIRYSNELKKGRKVDLPEVSYRKASSIEFTSTAKCAIEADGEWLGWLPAKVTLSSVRLKILAP